MAWPKGSGNPKTVGDRTTAIVLAALLKVYDTVLLPFGENQRYDLVVQDGDTFIRVQCKTGRLRRGVIEFPTCSSYYHHPDKRGTVNYRRHYRGSADVFGIYCPETQAVYLVPVENAGKRQSSLRVEPPKNNQRRKLRWASEHELKVLG